MKFRIFFIILCFFCLIGMLAVGSGGKNSVKAVDKVYKISILSDDSLPVSDQSARSDHSLIERLYQEAGHTVTCIDCETLADAQKFSVSTCDILILPTGDVFPQKAVANFKKFVMDGGRVITLGGYAFSTLTDEEGKTIDIPQNEANEVSKDMLLGSKLPLYAQDQLRYDPSQMPIFDEEHFYDSAITLRPAQEQAVFSGELNLSGAEVIKGYSAITTTGNYRGRWQPLIYAYDHVGTRVGTVGAIFHIYSTPSMDGYMGMFRTWEDYKATSIAFFGVTSHDLLADGNDALRQGFVKLADVLMADTYVASVDNKYDNYRQGETPEFDVFVENGSEYSQKGLVELTITAEDDQQIVASVRQEFSVDANSRATVHLKWIGAEFHDDFYEVTATVILSDGTVTDRYQTGFSVWNEDVIAAGPKYVYENNYIHLVQPDGSKKAIFTTGVDDGGNLLINEDQTPLVWREEFIRRQDTGMFLYECLQQYRNAGDFAHLFASAESLEKHYRSVDNIVYLAQKYGQIYMMGIAIGDDVSAGGDELEKIAQDVTYLARRYASVPGIIYYLNGDLICRVTNEKNKADFNAYLTDRYGDSTALNKAWGTFGLALGNVDLDPQYSYNGTGWTDVRAYDQNLFKTTLITRWTSRLLAAIRQTGQEDKIVLCEFYSWPAESVDIPLALGEMTYSNIGFFQTRQEFTQQLAYSDQRYRGKSFGIGETGRRTHPTFRDSELIYRSASYDESRDFFFTGLLSTYTMGGNHYQQWSWNDESKYVFPWGMNYTGDKAPRDLYYWFRNTNFVLKQTEPKYEVPDVAIILPDSTRASGSEVWYGGHYGAVNALDILQLTHLDSVLTLNESNLVIDPNIKVIFYPMAYTVSEDVYQTLMSWVRQGGTLYISGDFTYDPVLRTREYSHRIRELAGVDVLNVNYAGLDQNKARRCNYSDGTNRRYGMPNLDIELQNASALYATLYDDPVIVHNKLGSGNVVYSTDPLEYANKEDLRMLNVVLYRQVLEIAGMLPDTLETDGVNFKLFRLSLADGGNFYELLNVDDNTATGILRSAFHNYGFKTMGGNADYLRESADGRLLALLTEGDLTRDGQMLVSNSAFAHICSLDAQDISRSARIVVMPQQTGSVSIRSDARFNRLSVRIGQIENGMWIDMGPVYSSFSDGMISFDVTEDMVNAIVLIGESEDVSSLESDGMGYKVADMLVNGGARGCTTAEKFGGQSRVYGSAPKDEGFSIVTVAGRLLGGLLAVGGAMLALHIREKRAQKKQ